MNSKVLKICTVCGKEYKVWPVHAEKTKFCSYKCMGAKFISPNRLGLVDGFQTYRSSNGRVKIVLKPGREKSLSIYLAEKILGRPIGKNIVHHVNGDHTDDSPGNLMILQNQKEHRLLHARMRILRAGGDPHTHKICGGCKQVKLHAEFCKSAYELFGLAHECRDCAKIRNRKNYMNRMAKRKSNA